MDYIESLLAEREEIVLRTRQHWIVLARSFLTNLFLFLVFIILAIIATLSLGPVGIVLTLLTAFPIGAFLLKYLAWWNEEYVITNRRVIQSQGIINKQVIDSSLEKVNDVVLYQSFLGRLLGFGDIEILTASEIGVNALHHIADPVRFKTEMLNQKQLLGVDERVTAPTPSTQDIPSLIAALDALRQRGILTEAEFQQKKAELLARM
ncbi:MAG: PH domain-containing protein [Anaerolineae bacterium]|nr:PH domain-containing protein [Anaerolineae bacterium]